MTVGRLAFLLGNAVLYITLACGVWFIARSAFRAFRNWVLDVAHDAVAIHEQNKRAHLDRFLDRNIDKRVGLLEFKIQTLGDKIGGKK